MKAVNKYSISCAADVAWFFGIFREFNFDDKDRHFTIHIEKFDQEHRKYYENNFDGSLFANKDYMLAYYYFEMFSYYERVKIAEANWQGVYDYVNRTSKKVGLDCILHGYKYIITVTEEWK